MKFNCIDSFSGAGGLSLGLQEAGFDIIFSFDNDPISIKTQRNNPHYFNHKSKIISIEELLGGEIFGEVDIEPGDLFLLAGGPPCQGFSVQRIGPDQDDRNNLIFGYVDLVKNLNPQYFLMENVPGITGKRGRSILNSALSELEKAGYWIHKEMLDAQNFGIPQRRKRLFVVGERKDGLMPFFKFPPKFENDPETVREVIGDLPKPPQDGSDHPDIPNHRSDRLSEKNKERLKALEPGQGREDLPKELLTASHRKNSASKIGHRNVYGRMSWDDVAPTITARFDSFTRGQFGHPEQLRSISLREGALLQTFPHDFEFLGTKVEVARQIGNAVPPKLAKILGLQIIRSHKLKIETKHEKKRV